jgi:hypothetical protein
MKIYKYKAIKMELFESYFASLLVILSNIFLDINRIV